MFSDQRDGEKVGDESEKEHDDCQSRVQSQGKAELRDAEKPDKTFTSKRLTPSWCAISRWQARCKRRPETRDCAAISEERFALALPKGFFLAKDQPINKQPARLASTPIPAAISRLAK